MAGKTPVQVVAAVLTNRAKRLAEHKCLLCELPQKESEALKFILQQRDASPDRKPSFETATSALNSASIQVGISTVRKHYREHWNGKKPAANRS